MLTFCLFGYIMGPTSGGNMCNGQYTYAVNFYKNVPGLGWTFQSFRTTDDALKGQLKDLAKKQAAGTVRMIDAIKLDNKN